MNNNISYRSKVSSKLSENVFLFIPNIIGYARIILNIIAFWYIRTDYVVAAACYLSSVLLDEFDGFAAMMFNQCTEFGAMLDHLTDRTGTMCLLVTLAYFYPQWMFVFQMSMTIDIAGHWLHLHSSKMKGVTSYKLIDLSGNPILRLYYTSKPVLSFMCIGNELFYTSLYLWYFTEGPQIPLIFWACGLWKLLFYMTMPISLVKTGISVVHLVVASQNIAIIDGAERARAREEQTK